jgi:hypothetical protein
VSHHPDAKLYQVRRVDFEHNRWDRNLLWQAGNPLRIGELGETPVDGQWEEWRSLGEDPQSVVADPCFIDPTHDDYRLADDSPAYALGFEPIPMEKIGPYRDELRASWPIVEANGARERPLRL